MLKNVSIKIDITVLAKALIIEKSYKVPLNNFEFFLASVDSSDFHITESHSNYVWQLKNVKCMAYQESKTETVTFRMKPTILIGLKRI